MRGAFNKTSDWYFGPQSPWGAPDVMYATEIPCRYVPQNEIFQEEFPFSTSYAWITVDLVTPNLPITICPLIGYTFDNWFQADRVAIPSGVAPEWYVARREYVAPYGRAGYWRALLLPLSSLQSPPWPPPSPLPPLPPPPPVPGATCATAGVLAVPVDMTYTSASASYEWWKWEIPESGIYRFLATTDTAGGGWDMYTGSCDDLTLLDSGGYGMCSQHTLIVPKTVYLRLAKPSGATLHVTFGEGFC